MSSSRSAEPPGPGRRLRLALLGSTGSIGRQAIDVIDRDPSLEVVALAAGRNAPLLAEQARKLRPKTVILADVNLRAGLGDIPAGTSVGFGADALEALAARQDIDLLVVATGGMVSLRPVLAALRTGTVVATANKETLVAGGHLVMPLARALAADRAVLDPRGTLASPLGWIRPIDSEHSAIWQCLAGESPATVARLILTASGGPFLDLDAAGLTEVSPAAALRHPIWRMGDKITIDSATLANKGLEVIEAHWLYDVPYEAIDVVIHPQSVVHSAVLFVDGSVKAQLGTPDMRLPIQYALTHPNRRPSPAAPPDLVAAARLDFRAPDEGRFPALRIVREAGRLGPWASATVIAADEVAVARFLAGSLDFPGIPRLLEAAVARFGARSGPDPDIDELIALETEVRAAFATAAVA